MSERKDWSLDESAHAGPEHLDRAYVGAYDRKSPTNWDDAIHALQSLGIDQSSVVVDLGAGTGAFAAAVAPHVARVVAVDVSEPMVESIRARGIEAVRAGFLSYQHQGALADAVFTRNALHHLPDFWKTLALTRIATSILRPGGILLIEDIIFSFDPGEAETALAAWFSAAPTDPVHGWTAAQLAEHVRTEYSTFSWLLEEMIERAGFDIRQRWLSDNGIYGAYTCVRRADP